MKLNVTDLQNSLWLFFVYIDYIYAGILLALMLCMGLFFAFSDLFLYYVIQPYDSAQNNKSKVHQIINGMIFAVAYIMFGARNDLMSYTIFMIAITAIYLCIGMALLLCLAPKRFKLR